MGHKVTFAAKAALDRKLEAAKAEAAAIFDRQFGEKFVPTSKAEREQAAKSAFQRDVQRGRPTVVINQLTGEQLVGLPAARHLQDVNEATRLFNFQQRTQKDPLDPVNRTLSRDEVRAMARSGQRAVEKQRRTKRDPFAPPKSRKQAKGFKPTRQKRQAPGTARSIITRSRPRTRKA